jgi:hypothetical protein
MHFQVGDLVTLQWRETSGMIIEINDQSTYPYRVVWFDFPERVMVQQGYYNRTQIRRTNDEV